MQRIMKLLKWGIPIIAVLIVGLATFTGQLSIASGRAFTQVTGQHFTSYTYGGIQHIIFIGQDNHIDELYSGPQLNAGQWWHTDLTQTATNDGTITAASGSPLVGYSDATQHVIFIGSDGDLHEFRSTGNPVTWMDIDLTKTVPGICHPASQSPLIGYIWQGIEHIIYIDSNNHIDELYYSDNNWTFNDLTGNDNPCPAQGSSLASYVWTADNSQHVIYIDSNNHIQELWSLSNTGPWNRTDQTTQTQAPVAESKSALTGYTEGTREHIIYIDTNTHIHETVYDSSDKTWTNTDLTTAVPNNSNTPASGSGLTSYSDSVQHIMYTDSNNHIQELWSLSSTGSWNLTDLTSTVTNPSTALSGSDLIGYIWQDNGTQLVIYIGSDNNIYEISDLLQGGPWQSFNITTAWPTTAPTANGDRLG